MRSLSISPCLFIALSALVVSACGGVTTNGSSGAGGGGGGGGGSSSSNSAGGGGAGGSSSGIQCTGNEPMFPSFDKSCDTAASCVVKLHMINCCGTRIAIGISAGQSAAFDEAEAICEAMYPGCGCAQQPTKAEDGKETSNDAAIMVDCKAGTCSTYVP